MSHNIKQIPETKPMQKGETPTLYVNRCRKDLIVHLVKMGNNGKSVKDLVSSGDFKMVWNGWEQSPYKNLKPWQL